MVTQGNSTNSSVDSHSQQVISTKFHTTAVAAQARRWESAAAALLHTRTHSHTLLHCCCGRDHNALLDIGLVFWISIDYRIIEREWKKKKIMLV